MNDYVIRYADKDGRHCMVLRACSADDAENRFLSLWDGLGFDRLYIRVYQR